MSVEAQKGGGSIVPTHSQPQWWKAEGGQHQGQPLYTREIPAAHFMGRSVGLGAGLRLQPQTVQPRCIGRESE